jgi:hypothetical protein
VAARPWALPLALPRRLRGGGRRCELASGGPGARRVRAAQHRRPQPARVCFSPSLPRACGRRGLREPPPARCLGALPSHPSSLAAGAAAYIRVPARIISARSAPRAGARSAAQPPGAARLLRRCQPRRADLPQLPLPSSCPPPSPSLLSISREARGAVSAARRVRCARRAVCGPACFLFCCCAHCHCRRVCLPACVTLPLTHRLPGARRGPALKRARAALKAPRQPAMEGAASECLVGAASVAVACAAAPPARWRYANGVCSGFASGTGLGFLFTLSPPRRGACAAETGTRSPLAAAQLRSTLRQRVSIPGGRCGNDLRDAAMYGQAAGVETRLGRVRCAVPRRARIYFPRRGLQCAAGRCETPLMPAGLP